MADARVRPLAVLIALLFGLGAVGLVTVEDPGGSSRVGLEPSGAADGSRPGEPPPEGPSPGTPSGDAVPGAEAGEPSAAPAAGVGAIPAPRPGTYRYRQTTKSRSEFSTTTFLDEKTEEVERRIERVSESADEIVDRRHVPNRVTSSGSDGSKSESRSYEERVWRPDGEALRREVHQSTNTAPDGTKTENESECDWEPDRLQLVFPLRVGLEWSWDSSCSGVQADGEATTRNKGQAKITGRRDLGIGGRTVPTFVIELTATEDTSGRLGESRDTRFETHSDQRTISFFAPTLGLSVRVEAEHTNDSTFEGSQGGPQRSRTMQSAVAELLSTEPA